jgi:hypothetical protein
MAKQRCGHNNSYCYVKFTDITQENRFFRETFCTHGRYRFQMSIVRREVVVGVEKHRGIESRLIGLILNRDVPGKENE